MAETVPARLLDDVRVSMKELLAQNINAWGEVDRLHAELREVVPRVVLLEGALAEAISIISGGRNLDSARNRKAEEWRELLKNN